LVADVKPFRALRYAVPSDAVVAPPYDVLDAAARDAYRARDPHNVVHLTLNESEDEAGRLFHEWRENGILVLDAAPAAWVVEQDYVGPDGVERTRTGLVASLGVEPYVTKSVLPHERTHAGPKESRLRLLRAARAQLEPIFLLYDGEPPVSVPLRPPSLAAEGTRLWRIDGDGLSEFFASKQLLIADGHHRYETAVAFAAEDGRSGSNRMLVVLVSTSDPGLEIFPTHRVFTDRADIELPGETAASLEAAMELLDRASFESAAAVLYRGGVPRLVHGRPGELDVELVDRVGHEGISYTPTLSEAVRRVDEREADCAFLLRATRIEDVFERARRGVVMPQKTTYFYPKLLSGLLFHPLDP
jgi:uncharacterized protein (DUF1015 family)